MNRSRAHLFQIGTPALQYAYCGLSFRLAEQLSHPDRLEVVTCSVCLGRMKDEQIRLVVRSFVLGSAASNRLEELRQREQKGLTDD